jgi:acyl-CoA thioester hydrolase
VPYKHEIEVRVYYQDTDAQGIVYHANYLNFAERGRMEFLRSLNDASSRIMKPKGLNVVVRHIDIEYFASARLDDVLRLVTYVGEMRNSSFIFHCDMYLGDKLITVVKVTAVVVNEDYKAVRVPDELRALLV